MDGVKVALFFSVVVSLVSAFNTKKHVFIVIYDVL